MQSDILQIVLKKLKYEQEEIFSYLSLISRLKTWCNDIDVLAYLIQKLPITLYIGQYVHRHDAVISDALAESPFDVLSIIANDICPRVSKIEYIYPGSMKASIRVRRSMILFEY